MGPVGILPLNDSWHNILLALNPFLYRSYVYDHETSLYYLQSRYYDLNTHRFLNADAFTSTGQGLLGNNMFAYCRNNPVTRVDPTGNRDNNFWSLKNDEMGRELLAWYLYGDGEEFPTQEKHSAYLKKNKLIKTTGSGIFVSNCRIFIKWYISNYKYIDFSCY